MADHSVYLAENLSDFVQTPGFPYLRLHPALIQADYPDSPSETEEQVLLAMHSLSNNLLVVSNKHVCVYKIPRYKPFLERMAVTGAKITLGLVPGVSQAMEIADKLGDGRDNLKAWGNLLGGLSGKAKRERAADLQRTLEGMPTKKELEDLTWDTRDEKTLMLILCYRDRILLENGFEWKVNYRASLERSERGQNHITINESGLAFQIGGKSTHVPFPRKKFDGMALASALIQIHQERLASTGWSVEGDHQKILLKDMR